MIAVVLARAAESTDEVCSSYPWPCDAVYDSTGNEVVAHIVGWLTDKPLKILVILAVALRREPHPPPRDRTSRDEDGVERRQAR